MRSIYLITCLGLWSCATAALYPAGEKATPAPTSLGALAARMKPGTWAALETNGFKNGAFLETAAPGKSVLQWADKAVWDPKNRQLRFVGSPHYDPYKHIIYTDSDNTWSEGALPIPANSLIHGYEHNAVDPATGESYFRAYFTAKVYKYNPVAHSWSSLPDIPVPSMQCCGALEWFPERNGLLFVDGDWGVFFYSAKSSHWTQVAATNGGGDTNLPRLKMGSYSNFASYSPSAKAIVFGGGGATKIYKFDAAGRIDKLGDAPITLGIASSIITVDPVSGKHLVFGKDRTFWEYDMQTDTWHPLKVSAVPLFEPSMTPAVFDIVAAPVSTYGVVMFVKYAPGQSKVYLYKHSASALASHQ